MYNSSVVHSEDSKSREKTIVRTSVIGILANLFLAAFKAGVGFFSNSIAVVLDAVNNLSDALSSIITIVGTKLSSKPSDKKHPLGHGRVEYLTAMAISVIILYAGVTSLIESIKKIIHPETPDYGWVSLVIIAVAVVVKIVLGLFVKRVGNKVNSASLVASGKDALFDAIISTSVLVAAVIYLIFHLSLEAYLGALISLFILKSGIDMLRETFSQILGERVDSETSLSLKKYIATYENVKGVYDLVLHAYGPEQLVGSVHIEVPHTMTAPQIDMLERKIQTGVFKRFSIILEGISIYSINYDDEETRNLFKRIKEIALSYENVIQIHGFSLDKETKTVRFDLIISFDEKDRRQLFCEIVERIQSEFPDYSFWPTLDTDISD